MNNSIVKYVIALGLIAVFAVFAGFSIQNLIKSQKKSANVINLSGKQRMHSQRIAFFVNLVHQSDSLTEIAEYRQQLSQLKNDMMLIHRSFINGNDSLNVPKINSDSIYNLYFGAPVYLNEQVENYLMEVDTFLNTTNIITKNTAVKKINTIASSQLLQSLDRTVSQYVREKNQIVRKMEIRGLIAILAILILLILEYFFIFKPLKEENERNSKKLLQQNQRLENLNHDLEQFIYAASHDLKTPIRGIYSLIQFLELDFIEDLKEEAKDYLYLIKSRVQRINVLIDGLRRFGSIGRGWSQITDVNLNEYIQQFSEKYNSENIQITTTSHLPTLTTNATWINDIFSNLIENAIQHSGRSDCKITIGHTEDDDVYQFYVKDNGIGTDSKYYEKMFKLFQTLSNKEHKPTAGIGLAIVKKIVAELGGKVWIDSIVNEHFTVYFTIPKTKELA